MQKLVLATVILGLAASSQAWVESAKADTPSAPPPAVTAQATAAAATHAATVPAPQACQPGYVATPTPVTEVPVDKEHRKVFIQTNYGDITVQLDHERAPQTVDNFLRYVKDRYFDKSGFYRVMPGFVIQGGDYTPALDYHPPRYKPIQNESGNGLSNLRGSIAMAHDTPNSAQAAFFINLVDNRYSLDPRSDGWGYAVFGQVVSGMDVVDKIAAVKTHSVVLVNAPQPYDDVPEAPVKILKITLLPLPAKKP